MVKHQYIVLKGVNANEVAIRYGITQSQMDPIHSHENVMKIAPRTHISDLSTTEHMKDKPEVNRDYIFLDEARNHHDFVVTMKNFVDEYLPITTDIHCFWCRHAFSSVPIGCPISYIPQRLEKKIPCDYKDDVIVRENISKSMFKNLNTDFNNSFINKECYYRVDGIFCSFPCVLAFIRDNKHDVLYQNSESLLRLMHRQCFPDSHLKHSLSIAPSWRLLQNYGGDLSIQQFRDSFSNTEYINHYQHINRLPMQKLTGFLFEPLIKI